MHQPENTVHDFVLDSCILYDYYGGAGGLGFDATPEGAADRIYNGVIRNCKAFLTAGAFDNCDGFALGHDGVSDILFYNCETPASATDSTFSGARIVLERCSAHNSSTAAVQALAGQRHDDQLRRIRQLLQRGARFRLSPEQGVKARLINCTFHACWNTNIWIENSAGGSTLELYNCIVAGGSNVGLSFDGDSIRGYTGDYNLFHMNAPDRAVATSQYDFSLTQLQNGEWTAFSGRMRIRRS